MEKILHRGTLFIAASIFLISLVFLGRVGHDLMTMQRDLNWARLEQVQLYRLYTVAVDAEIARLHYANRRDENSSQGFSKALDAVRHEADDAARVSVRYEPSPFVVTTVKLMSDEAKAGTAILSVDARGAKDATQSFDLLAPRLRSDLQMAIDQNLSYSRTLNTRVAAEAATFFYVLLGAVAGLTLAYIVTKPRRAREVEREVADQSHAFHFWQ